MKKLWKAILTASLVLTLSVPPLAAATPPKPTQKQYYKRLKYNKNALPAGWQFEAGYTFWRTHHGLPATLQSYKAYKRDKAWRYALHKYNRPGEIVLDTLDWTAQETGRFWETYNEYFKFQPAGYEEIRGP